MGTPHHVEYVRARPNSGVQGVIEKLEEKYHMVVAVEAYPNVAKEWRDVHGLMAKQPVDIPVKDKPVFELRRNSGPCYVDNLVGIGTVMRHAR